MMKVLLTGCAGFIGMHAGLQLLARGNEVIGIDNFTPYYDVNLKRARVLQLIQHANFRLVEADRTVPVAVKEYFQEVRGEHMAWLTHPRRMLRHKALTQCARLAFSLSGIYDSDETQRVLAATNFTPAKRQALKPSNKDLIKAALIKA